MRQTGLAAVECQESSRKVGATLAHGCTCVKPEGEHPLVAGRGATERSGPRSDFGYTAKQGSTEGGGVVGVRTQRGLKNRQGKPVRVSPALVLGLCVGWMGWIYLKFSAMDKYL